MKKNFKFLVLLLTLVLVIGVVGCTNTNNDYNAEYSIVINTIENGTIKADKIKAKQGEKVVLTITPNKDYILKADSLKVNGKAINGMSFTMPAKDIKVTAIFEKKDYNIIIPNFDNGKIVTKCKKAKCGEEVIINFLPNQDYEFQSNSLKINSGKINFDRINSTQYKFIMPNKDVNIYANFEMIRYTITIGFNNGDVECNKLNAKPGEEKIIKVIPTKGYILNKESIKINDGKIKYKIINANTFSFLMPKENVNVNYINTYVHSYSKIELDSYINGNIILNNYTENEEIEDKKKIIFTVIPDKGYELNEESLKIDNGSPYNNNCYFEKIAINQYSFKMPCQNVTIKATFQKKSFPIKSDNILNDKVKLNKIKALAGEEIILSIIPNTEYKILDNFFIINNGKIKYTKLNSTQYKFIMPEENVYLIAVLDKILLNINVIDTNNGEIFLDKACANMGEAVYFTVRPSIGYKLKELRNNNEIISHWLTEDGKYYFNMPNNGNNILPIFIKDGYDINIVNSSNGKINLDKKWANRDDIVNFTVIPNYGYKLKELRNNNKIISYRFTGNGKYYFYMPGKENNIQPVFEKYLFNIEIKENNYGNIILENNCCKKGERVKYEIKAKKGYKFKSIKVINDDVNLEDYNNGYNGFFIMPEKNIKIAVIFVENLHNIEFEKYSNGKVKLNKSKAKYGDEVIVQIFPEKQYKIGYILLDCHYYNKTPIKKLNDDTYSFIMPARDIIVSLRFQIINKYSYDFQLNKDEKTYCINGIGNYRGDELIIPSEFNGKKVTKINDRAFNGSYIKSIELTDEIKVIGSAAFNCCMELIKIVLPNEVTSIGRCAFGGCINLKEVKLSEKIISLSEAVFYDCKNLSSIIIPNSVVSIGKEAFFGCEKLNKIILPYSITKIDDDAFNDCSSLTSIFVDSNNPKYHSNGNCLIETKNKELILGCQNSIIPRAGSVTSIGDGAFSGCGNLTSITIPESVTSIGERVFYDCKSLKSIIIPESVTSIGNKAFYDCKSLKSITILKGLISIGYEVFYGCSDLTSITIPESVISIGDDVFKNCTNLTSIKIPDSVTSIGDGAFKGCSHLKSIIIPNSVISIGICAFYNCSSLTSIIIPESVTSIDFDVFEGCSSLTSIIVDSDNPKYHSDGNCLIETENKKIILGCQNSCIPTDGSVTSIGYHAFNDCENLTSITIPNSVISIGGFAFDGCSSLTSITLLGNKKIIHKNVFDGCLDDYKIYVPEESVAKYKTTYPEYASHIFAIENK